jgi:beta-galactosidase
MVEVKLDESDQAITASTQAIAVRVSKKNGAIESFRFLTKELLSGPLVPNFWRPPIDNDNGNGMPKRLGAWRQAGPKRRIVSVKAEQLKPQVVRVTAEYTLPTVKDSKYANTYTIYGSGDIVVKSSFEPGGEGLPDLPRFGMQMPISREFGMMTWFGRGPHETYWDRKTGAAIGLYSGPVSLQVHKYVRPQETGNKTDVRWMALTNGFGIGILAVGIPNLSVSAWPWTMQQLEDAKHISDLKPAKTITVNLDYRQMGVGGDDSWGARTHPEYTLPAKPYSYKFLIRPYTRQMGNIQAVAGRVLPEIQ